MTASDLLSEEEQLTSPRMPGNGRGVAGSAPPSAPRERAKFEKWMRKYWGGIGLATTHLGRNAFEYKESSAQTAWEVWQRFTGLKS